jgi:hypothetical protein
LKIKTGKNVKAFLAVADSCEGHVWLESPWGDRYNLKSELSAYVAAYKLIKDYGEQLQLYCPLAEDEQKFYKFFKEHPEVLE